MKNIFYTLAFFMSILILSSCGSSSDTTKSVRTNPHAEAHMEMHRELQAEQAQKELMKKQEENMEPSKADLQKLLMAKNQKGIDFYAMGNEPFWDLNMDFEKEFHFKTMNGIDFTAPAAKFVKAIDNNIIKYESSTELGEIIVRLNKSKCADNMSGQPFDYQVTVEFKASGDTNFKTYKGCGNYVPDFRLYNIWAIVEVDGIKVNPADFKKNAPRLEINLTENTAFGTDGCNNFNGSFKTEYKRIFIGNLASTMMACFENEEISAKIGKILSNSNLDYSFKNNQLFFSQNNKIVMVLKNID